MITSSLKFANWRFWGLGLAGFFYVLQCFSPLRLNTDAILYLSLAASGVDGGGFVFQGSEQKVPLGYPLLIGALDRLGIANSMVFILINCSAVFGGLWAVSWIIRSQFKMSSQRATGVCILTLLNYSFIKHLTLPMTDMLCFLTSSLALYFMVRSEIQSANLRRAWLLATLFVVLSLYLRPISITLIPPLLWILYRRMPWPLMKPRTRISWVVIIVVLSIFPAARLLKSDYFSEQIHNFSKYGGVLGLIAQSFWIHIQEWGQLTLNFPKTKIPDSLGFSGPMFFMIGLMALVFFLTKISRQIGLRNSVAIYLACYLGILFMWPCEDPRFWLPIVPFGAAFILPTSSRYLRLLVLPYLLFGLAALGFSTRVTFSGEKFPDTYGDGGLRATYRSAFNQGDSSGQEVNVDALGVLRRFESRAKK